jgi:ankyrin repeat protein
MPSKILEAVYRRRHAELAALLAGGAELTICEAAAVGDARRVRALLDVDRRHLHQRSDDGWTALHLAAHFGRGDAVDALLAAGADVHAWSENALHNQPLHAAMAGSADLRILTALLAKGAKVNAVEHGGYTPLHLAAGRGELGLVNVLLAHGASAEAATDEGKTAEALARERGHTLAARRLRGEMP